MFAVFVLAACTDELLPENPAGNDSDKVTISFSLGIPETESLSTRSMSQMTDDKRLRLAVHLFVFDNNGYFVERATAVEKENVNTFEPDRRNHTNFKVTLTKSGTPRRIHFVAVDTVEAGANKTFNDVVEMKYSYGSEATVMNGMSVSTPNDAYWQSVTVDGINDDTKFERVPLIRNFNHITAEVVPQIAGNHHFELTGLAVLHRPTKGSVAPYNSLTGSFQVFTNGEDMLTYHEIAADGHYQGYQPSDMEWMENDSTNVTFYDPATGIYMYGTRNATGAGVQGRTYAIIRGNFHKNDGTTYNNRYYKIDIIYKNADGTANFYNILRNFHFRIIIQSVTFEGYATPAEAARAPATNNISASVQAQAVNNIGDGSARRLFLNNLYFCFTKGGASDGDILAKFFGYLDDAATQTGWRNNIINVSVLDGSDDIFQVQPSIAGGTMDGNNWSKVQFTLKEPTDVPQTATVRFAVHGVGRFETLYRDVTILLRKPYEMLVDCQDVVQGAIDAEMFVNVLVPDGINSMLFPLPFYIEGEHSTFYPNVSENHLPVHVGKSIVVGNSSNSFQFEKTLTAEEYNGAVPTVVGGQTYRIIPCYFKTSKSDNATRIFVANEYFNTASDIFVNGTAVFPETDKMKVEVVASDYYGAGNSYNYVKFLTVSNNAAVTVTLNENGTTWSQQINLGTTTNTHNVSHSYVNNGDGTFTHTVRIPTQTFSGSSYTATVSYNGNFSQSFEGTGSMGRQYIFVPIGSFQTNVGSNGYNEVERFRSYTGGENTGRLNFTANGTTEYDTDYPRTERTDGGFVFSGNAGYHINTSLVPNVTESTVIRFFDPSSKNHWEGDENGSGWEASVTVGEFTSRHAVDLAAGATEATGTAAGLYKWQLTFAQP